MPKEITHIMLANEAVRIMAASGNRKKAALGRELSSLAQKYPRALAFGSVSPDIFFYDIQLPWEHKSTYRGLFWGELIHGTQGEDSLKHIIIQLVKLRDQKQKTAGAEMLLAFTLGYLSHVALDTMLHPLVYHFAGDYYHSDPAEKKKAETRHRVIETVLDLQNITAYGTDLKKFNALKRISLSKTEATLILPFMAEALSEAWPEHSPGAATMYKTVRRGYKKLLAFNRLFSFRLFTKAALRYNRRRHDGLSDYSSLLYPARSYTEYLSSDQRRRFRIEDLRSYRHPLTNRETQINPNFLHKQILARAQAFFTAAYKLANNQISEQAARRVLRGYSLNNGRVGIRTDAMKFFSPLPVNGNFEWLSERV